MQDDDSGSPVNQQPIEDRPDARLLDSPTLPDDPHPPAAEGISRQEVQSEVKDIEDRVKRAERWMIGLTAAIAFFGLCAVIVSVLQWNAVRGQLRMMQLTLYIDQRPWIRLQYGEGDNLQTAPSRDTIQKNTVTNIGKSPVFRLSLDMAMDIVRNGSVPDFDWNKPHWQASVPIVLPNDPFGAPAEVVEETGKKHLLTRPEFDSFKDGSNVLITFARISYRDALGIPHIQQFCNWAAFPGVSNLNQSVTHKKCVDYNAADNNKPK